MMITIYIADLHKSMLHLTEEEGVTPEHAAKHNVRRTSSDLTDRSMAGAGQHLEPQVSLTSAQSYQGLHPRGWPYNGAASPIVGQHTHSILIRLTIEPSQRTFKTFY